MINQFSLTDGNLFPCQIEIEDIDELTVKVNGLDSKIYSYVLHLKDKRILGDNKDYYKFLSEEDNKIIDFGRVTQTNLLKICSELLIDGIFVYSHDYIFYYNSETKRSFISFQNRLLNNSKFMNIIAKYSNFFNFN